MKIIPHVIHLIIHSLPTTVKWISMRKSGSSEVYIPQKLRWDDWNIWVNDFDLIDLNFPVRVKGHVVWLLYARCPHNFHITILNWTRRFVLRLFPIKVWVEWANWDLQHSSTGHSGLRPRTGINRAFTSTGSRCLCVCYQQPVPWGVRVWMCVWPRYNRKCSEKTESTGQKINQRNYHLILWWNATTREEENKIKIFQTHRYTLTIS